MTRDEIIKALGVASGQMTVTLGAYIAAAPVWDLQTIERVVDEAVKQEREACATVCRERAMKCEHEAQEASANGEQDESVSLRATAWQMTICAKRIRARSQQ